MTSRDKLVNQINKKLEKSALFYFSRDVERALGLEDVLNNYYVVCIDNHPLVEMLLKKGIKVFCAEREKVFLKNKTIKELVQTERLQEWIKSQASENKYAALFYPEASSINRLKKLGFKVLNNPANLRAIFENKISASTYFKREGLNTPTFQINKLENLNYKSLSEELGEQLVIQLEKGHTGSGTFIVKSEKEFQEISQRFSGTLVKISELIIGDPLTLNVCITKEANFINGLQYQITGVPGLTSSPFATVGNDFSRDQDMPSQIKHSILILSDKIAQVLRAEGYRGLFGIDLVLSKDGIFLIEVNARQTANIPFQTFLENTQTEQPSLLLLHYAEFFGINLTKLESEYKHLNSLEGSQLFFRASNNSIIKFKQKFGTYSVKTGNFTSENLSLKKLLKDDLLFTGFFKNSERRFLDEVARVQLIKGIIDKGSVNNKVLNFLLDKYSEKS